MTDQSSETKSDGTIMECLNRSNFQLPAANNLASDHSIIEDKR